MSKLQHGVGRESFREFLAANPEIIPIDHSRLELWDTCHRKFEYAVVHKLPVPVGVEAIFSNYMIHPPLSEWYRTEGEFDINITRYWTGQWKKFIAEASRTNLQLDIQLHSRAVAKMAIEQYSEQFQPDFGMYAFVASEELYWTTLPGVDDFVWFSLPDLMLQRKADKALVNVDFKFSKWDIQRDLSLFDRQFLGQSYASGSTYMMKAHMQMMTERGEPAPHGVRITRTFHPVDNSLMTEWEAELKQTLDEIRRALKAGVFVKRSPGACFQFRKVCEFHDVCPLGPTRNVVIQTMETADPMEYVWRDR